MKTILNTSKLILAGLIFPGTLVSCEPKSTPSILPEFKGEIKLDRTKIGKGQILSASYVIPTGGQNIEPTDIFWNWGDGYQILGKKAEKDGTAIISFVAPEVGEQTISFVAGYINLEKAEYEKKSISTKFNVVQCDVLTSFWNDSKATVIATANETFQDDKADVLTALIKNSLTQTDAELHQYYFGNDKLEKIVRVIFQKASVGKAVGYMNAHSLVLEAEGYNRTSFAVVNIATGEKTAVDMSKIKDVTYTTPISTGVEKGELELVVLLNNDKTNVTMSYKMQEVGLVLNAITYQPR